MIDLSSLKNKENICIFIRHGEKNINTYDLSEEGKKQTLILAEKLFELNQQICIFSSPEERCVATANIINDKIHSKYGQVYISDILGKPGIQVKNKIEYTKLTDIMRCRDIFCEWKLGKHYKAMYESEIIKEKIIDFFRKTSIQEGITLYISQSGTVACTGYSLNLVDYGVADNEWVGYLDGYIIRL